MAKINKTPLKLLLPLLIIVFLFAASLLSPLLPIYDPNKIDLESLKRPPNMEHPFGTDNKGRDIFVRVIYGGKISIGVAIVAAFISAVIGFGAGIASGYFGGRLDTVLMSVVDFILSFPSLLLAIAISVILPPGIYTVMIAISAVGWTSFARLIRGHVLTIRDMSFVDAARAMGCSDLRILFLHIAPLCIPLSLVMMGIKLGGFILTEATLSFLGLGAQPPTATWGSMISANRAYILTAPWMVIFPGLAISITAFCFNMLGESLKERYEFKDN
ncbi:MAG: ABC transporter permease [Nitrospirae bacterium]|jgi:peptide/nickel transport system permease protein|nr:ABC transporter permease [Nitrospirota bacterium]MCL5063400.1 ABC transporter permease [Nitrospirota bacterium]MDA8213778.1 ABC transporter permease [Nitrospiraceae bacterium]